MKSLYDASVRHEVGERLHALTPDHRAQWGRMTSHQAVCHLADGFRMVLGERPITMRGNFFLRTVARVFALTLPVPWPKGVETAPEVDQEKDGTPPAEFAADVATLETLMDRFVRSDGQMPTHPIFGNLRRAEWGRWAYRHLDHHLTQFGA